MKLNKCTTNLLFTLSLLFSSFQANAATAVVDSVTGKVIGLNQISITGFSGLYNLTFNNLWTSNNTYSSSFSVAAANSLLNYYTTGVGQGTPLDLNRTLVNGCEDVFNYTCQWFTPTSSTVSNGSTYLSGESFTNYDFHLDSADRVLSQSSLAMHDYATLTYLEWTPSNVGEVPLPAAAFMFAPALLGLGFMGLRRKAKKTVA